MVGGPAWGFELDRAHLRLIDQVNRGVNREFPPLRPFRDTTGDGVWDCENYAAEKEARLIEAGVPEADMRLMYVVADSGQGHAVLLVRGVRKGRTVELVLDCLTEWATPREQRAYTTWAPLNLDWRGLAVPR